MRHELEYAPIWMLVRVLGFLPLLVARTVGQSIALAFYLLHRRLSKVGMRNLEIAFPNLSRRQKIRVLRKLYLGLGRQLADVCHFPYITEKNISHLAVYDGFENFDRARSRGKGVLLLTAHFGGWEVGSFAHSVYGNKLKIVTRGLDNPPLEKLVTRYRTLYGNEILDKDTFSRGLIAAMRAGETVGILMDTNMTPPQGVFVDYFGRLACTASGVARLALRTDAEVVPAFTIWDSELRKYRIRFAPALPLIRTGDDEKDAISNTAMFTKAIESYVRKYPEQWLWVHRRWKTRPEGESPLY